MGPARGSSPASSFPAGSSRRNWLAAGRYWRSTTIQGSFLFFPALSMARMTTLPLWRMMSRLLSLPPGSINSSRSTRKRGPSNTHSELSTCAVSTVVTTGSAGDFRLFALVFLGFAVLVFLAFAVLDVLSFAALTTLGFLICAFFGLAALDFFLATFTFLGATGFSFGDFAGSFFFLAIRVFFLQRNGAQPDKEYNHSRFMRCTDGVLVHRLCRAWHP